MLTVLYIVGIIGTLGILFVVYTLIKIQQYSNNLYLFLFTNTWKTIFDCAEEGFTRQLTVNLLEQYYKSKLLEIRLNDHVYDCVNCKLLIAAEVMLGLKYEDIVLLNNSKESKIENLIFQIFENKMFTASTVTFFEFRIIKRGGRTRRNFWQTNLVRPIFSKPISV